ncbi:MAG TPA: ATP-binding protein [Verrucomicrobiae bacterium]|jgi:DNA replication protein DnaC|nr:ATP-binding protein [Verrucomicrobiae bacterium]
MASSPAVESESKPVCPICEGTGFTFIQVPGRSALRATRCVCRVDARTERLLKGTHLPARYEHCSLLNFETGSNFHESLSSAKLTAVLFVEKYPIEKEGLLFTGPIGVGKTHLAVGILQELVRNKGVQCLFCDYRELLKEIQNSYNPSVQTTELEILRPVFDAEVLLLDELGAIRPTEWVWDTVSHILNYRYNEKKTTLITTNFSDLPARKEEKPRKTFSRKEEATRAMAEETLGDRITERMRSRLHEMCRIVELDGTDYRMQIKNRNFQ